MTTQQSLQTLNELITLASILQQTAQRLIEEVAPPLKVSARGRRRLGMPAETEPVAQETETTPTGRIKRKLSPAARKRIADATKKRWAAYRSAKEAAAAPKPTAKAAKRRKAKPAKVAAVKTAGAAGAGA